MPYIVSSRLIRDRVSLEPLHFGIRKRTPYIPIRPLTCVSGTNEGGSRDESPRLLNFLLKFLEDTGH